ncbi:prolipoprotein diacylglyceryl transferase [Candidatus Dojkabacteria bacterium]|nr:prolipoprotein diacylglyceryl transferase [Candidatus Dojkabacteria bacterium]
MKKIQRKILIVLLSVTFIVVFLFAIKGKIQIPKSFQILNLEFSLYGIFIGVGIISVLQLLEKHTKYINKEQIWEGLIWALIPGIICARLYHVITDFEMYRNNWVDMFQIWKGGLGIFGGLIGGLIGLWFYTRKQDVPFLGTIEQIAVFLPIGQVIGRFGNFVNQEIFGPPTSLIWGMYIRPENRPEEYKNFSFFHPAFLYEQIGNVTLFVILYYFYKKRGVRKDGFFAVVYIFGYSCIRFIVEFFRLDPKIVWSLSYGQIVSLLFIMLCLLYFVFLLTLKNVKNN